MAGELLRVDQMFAFLGTELPLGEGVCGMTIPGLGFQPLVGADMERMRSLEPYAQQLARMGRREITLAVFSVRSDLKVLRP